MDTLDLILITALVVVLVVAVLFIVQGYRWNNIDGQYRRVDPDREADIRISKMKEVDADGGVVFTLYFNWETCTLSPVKWTLSGGERYGRINGFDFVLRMGTFSNLLSITKIVNGVEVPYHEYSKFR